MDAFCPENQKCVKPTSGDCECKNGFRNTSSGCIDIDECQENKCKDYHSEAKCLNTLGSYVCVEHVSTTSTTSTTKKLTTKTQDWTRHLTKDSNSFRNTEISSSKTLQTLSRHQTSSPV